MAYNGYAIDEYLDADKVNRQLDALIRKPVYSIRPKELENYVDNYFKKMPEIQGDDRGSKEGNSGWRAAQPRFQLPVPDRDHECIRQ